MGLLDLFRNARAPIELGLGEISGWVEDELERRGIQREMQALRQRIDTHAQEVQRHLDALEQASLRNERIPERARHMMQGNRAQYALAVRQFLESIAHPQGAFDAEQRMYEFSEQLTKLEERTAKNYYILKEFLEQEVREVVGGLKRIEDAMISTNRSLDKSGLSDFVRIQELLDELDAKHAERDRLHAELREEERILAEHAERVRKHKRRISELKQSSDYRRQQDLDTTLEQARQQETEAAQDFAKALRPLDKAIKRFNHPAPDPTLATYQQDPATALIEDTKGELPRSLASLRKALGSLGIDAKQASRLAKEAERLEKSFAEHRRRLLDARTRKDEAATALRNTMARWSLAEQQELLANAKQQHEEQKRRYEELLERYENVRPGLTITKIREVLNTHDVTLTGAQGADQPTH